MSANDCKGCQEYHRLSRRNFVGLTSGFLMTTAMPSWLPRVVLADSHDGDRDVMVSLFLRGGVDALSMCVPFNEKNYYKLRPTQAFPKPDSKDPNRVTALDGDFGFPPSMAPLLDAYKDKALAVVHATGLENPTRSHFDAMHFMEVGMGNPPPSLYTGWLGRHLQVTAPTVKNGVLRAVGIGYGLQRTLVGGPQTLPIQDVDNFGFGGNPGSRHKRERAIEAMYDGIPDPLGSAAQNTVKTIDLLKKINFSGYKPKGKAKYPNDEYGYALKSTAALIKADIGVEAVAIDLDGWDTHDEQGALDGWMAYLMETFAKGLAAFHKDMFASNYRNIIVVVMSEFGRNVFENGSLGTDHGHAGLMLALGGSVNGGQVITKWPGLNDEQLYEGQDLKITIDYRDILTEILTKRLANPDYTKVFTESQYKPKDYGIIT